MIKIICNPIITVIEAFNEVYPGYDCYIQFTEELETGKDCNGEDIESCVGVTYLPEEKGKIPIIEISANMPFTGVVETIGHELAHLATPGDLEHGPEWEKAFENIFNKYMEIQTRKCKEFEDPRKS